MHCQGLCSVAYVGVRVLVAIRVGHWQPEPVKLLQHSLGPGGAAVRAQELQYTGANT